MTFTDLIETLIHLICIGLLIHSIHDDPTGRADDGARMHAMCAWMLIVFNAMQIGITSTYLRDYGWLLSEPPTLMGVVNLVCAVIVLALVVRLTRDIRRKGKKGHHDGQYE